MEQERVVPGGLGRDLGRRLAALLAADPLEGVRREDDRRRPAGDVAVPILPRCKREMELRRVIITLGEAVGEYVMYVLRSVVRLVSQCRTAEFGTGRGQIGASC